MMDSITYQLLQRFADGYSIGKPDLLSFDDTTRAAIDRLKSSGYIRMDIRTIGSDWRYVISPQGLLALSAEQDARKSVTNQKANDYAKERSARIQAVADLQQQRRHDFKVAAFSVALTLLFEHVGDFIHFLMELFR